MYIDLSITELCTMAATLHVLHPRSAALAGFLRVGHTGQKRLEALQAAGRFPYRRVIFDAAHLSEQLDLLKALKAAGCEIVLDPNFAEMAIEARFRGAVSHLPWANPDRAWEPTDFGFARNADLGKLLAEFAVQCDTDAILAPTHLIESTRDSWWAIDLGLCERLRRELDQLGGRRIAIDYQMITTNAVLSDERQRRLLMSEIHRLPIENVFLRVSGFGATATGTGTRHFIEIVRDLHQFERPLVADLAGGLSALAALAFGAVGGISHGVGQKEAFSASALKRPSGGGGTARRIYVPEVDRHFTEEQLLTIFRTKGGRATFARNDTRCCTSVDEMIENNHSHFVTQRSRQIEDLSRVPEERRTDHFLLRHLDPAVRSARKGARLRIADEQVRRTVDEARARLARLRDALADLHSREGSITRSPPVAFRGGGRGISVVLGA
jgi:hypothetical protein